MDAETSHLATELADAAVREVDACAGEGDGLRYELAKLRAAEALARAALAASFSGYHAALLKRANVS